MKIFQSYLYSLFKDKKMPSLRPRLAVNISSSLLLFEFFRGIMLCGVGHGLGDPGGGVGVGAGVGVGTGEPGVGLGVPCRSFSESETGGLELTVSKVLFLKQETQISRITKKIKCFILIPL